MDSPQSSPFDDDELPYPPSFCGDAGGGSDGGGSDDEVEEAEIARG